ncbi:MAG: asparagine synthase-related protein [Alphaproteobacteria bacterium]
MGTGLLYLTASALTRVNQRPYLLGSTAVLWGWIEAKLKGKPRFERPKSGFVLPYDRWMRSTLGKQIDRTLTDSDLVRMAGLDPQAVATYWRSYRKGAKGQYWTCVWALYVLTQWCSRHGVGI